MSTIALRRAAWLLVGLLTQLVGVGVTRAALGCLRDKPLAPVVAAAASSGDRVIVLLTTRRCGGVSPQLADQLSSLGRARCLIFDGDAGEGRDVAERYHVGVVPTLLLLATGGGEVGRITDLKAGRRLPLQLKSLIAGRGGRVEQLEARLRRTPADLRLRLEVGLQWALRGRREPAERHLDQVVARDRANRRGLAARALLYKGQRLLLAGLRQRQRAARLFRALRRRYPGSAEAAATTKLLSRALDGRGRLCTSEVAPWSLTRAALSSVP